MSDRGAGVGAERYSYRLVGNSKSQHILSQLEAENASSVRNKLSSFLMRILKELVFILQQ